MTKLFQAIFCGELRADAEPDEVRAELERLGVLREADSVRAFAGEPIVLRDNLTSEQASRFASALAAANARCHVLADGWIACPGCAFPQDPDGAECVKCGLVFEKHRQRELLPVRTRSEIANDLKDVGYRKFSDEPA